MSAPQIATRSVVCPQPVPDATRRIFLLHHAGGSHLLFRDWIPYFPADWEVCLLEAPGRGRLVDVSPIDEAAALVSYLLEDVASWLGRRYVLFGHSMGALLAYELTNRLRDRRMRLPEWVGLSARAAPRPDGGLDVRNRHLMNDDELRRSIADMGGTPSEVLADPEWWAFLAPLIRADLRLVERWRPRPATPRLPVPVSVFGGDRDVVVRRERLADWSDHVERFVGLHMYPGDHFYFRDQTRTVVDQIVADARLAAGGGGG